ncbi:MAG: Dihydroorotate dehydrogenase B (NAD(+)), catalytic subunit [Deltaproteobacteria bacterium ADurb.BinA179]|nr:MAG: Dihydroorotate dehydrogenase B (NAD(+)), catalytic subunit [Deltaproteobacteria bacterium ADurb.BinA179]
MAIDEKTRRPILGNITGGLSGPAVKAMSLKIVWDVSRAVTIPVIASGGIMNARDVIQFMLAGATAVQVGSAGLRDPFCYPGIIDDVVSFLEEHGVAAMTELIGGLLTD